MQTRFDLPFDIARNHRKSFQGFRWGFLFRIVFKMTGKVTHYNDDTQLKNFGLPPKTHICEGGAKPLPLLLKDILKSVPKHV